MLAETLVRAGVGSLRIVDRDFVETSNLQRQVLFDENDVADRLPKAVAAADKLRRINSQVTIDPVVADVDHTNILGLVQGMDLILDGSDNFELRFLINDAALETDVPWIYAGVIGSHGQVMPIFPGESACLRCLIDRLPDPGTTETCDTAGVIAPAVQVVASLEAVDALKILSGQTEKVARILTYVDVWEGTFRAVEHRRPEGEVRLPRLQKRRTELAFRPSRVADERPVRPQRGPGFAAAPRFGGIRGTGREAQGSG